MAIGPLQDGVPTWSATCAPQGTLYPPHTGSKLLLATDKELEHESSYRSDFSPRPEPPTLRCLEGPVAVQPDVRRIARPGLFVKSYRPRGVSPGRSAHDLQDRPRGGPGALPLGRVNKMTL